MITGFILKTLLSIGVMFLISRLLGARQISQLSIFDYITSITLGSLGGDLALAKDDEIVPALIALVLYGVFTFLVSLLTDRSLRARKFLNGTPIVLASDGRLYRDSFKKAKLDINEFEAECRSQGYFDMSQIHTALMEHNGKISILPKAAYRPATAADTGAELTEERLSPNLILDGEIIDSNLAYIGKDREWLISSLASRGIESAEDVFLATYNAKAQLCIFVKLRLDDITADVFESK